MINITKYLHPQLGTNMLGFKEYLEEASDDNYDFLEHHLGMYEEYDSFNNLLEEDYAAPDTASIRAVQRDVDTHMGNYVSQSPKEKSSALKEANDYFKTTDFRTVKEKAQGQIAAKTRKVANYGLPRNSPKWKPESNFESPLKVSGEITTATDKHLSSGKGFRIPAGFGKKSGKGATVSALRLTPGVANLGDGKSWKSCAKATSGCAGSGEAGEAGVGEGALCLATRGTDAFIGSRKAKLARTRAFFHPEAIKHATVKLSAELERDSKKAEETDAIHHFRPNDSSDADVVTSAVNKHFPKITTYGYSKHLPHDTENPNNHISRSDTGPEFNQHGIQDPELHAAKNKTVEHLMGGKTSRAYVVMGQIRKKDVIMHEGDQTKDIHTIRYHMYDKSGNHIGHEDFDADRNYSNGDLRPYDKPAERNLSSNMNASDKRTKGAITVTDISGGKPKDITGKAKSKFKEESETDVANTMIHPIDDAHLQPDPKTKGKFIYHIDPPNGDYRSTTPAKKHFKIKSEM